MACNCNNLIKISSISNTGGSFFMISDELQNLANGKRFIVSLPTSIIPTLTTIDPTYIVIDGENIPLYDRTIGNFINSDQLRFICTNCCGNKIFRVVYGTNPVHFKLISQELPQSGGV